MPPPTSRPVPLWTAALGTCLAATVVAALAGRANDIATAEPHLAVVPRTAAEAVRIGRVTAPAADFAAREAFKARLAPVAAHLAPVAWDSHLVAL